MEETKTIVRLSQSRVDATIDEYQQTIREICKSSESNRNLFLEKSSFYGNAHLTKFLLFKLKEDWGEEQLRKAFENSIMSDDDKVVKIVLDKCKSSHVDVETTDMKDLAKKRGKTEVLKILNIPIDHKDPTIPITKHTEFEYVNVIDDIVKMLKEEKEDHSEQIILSFNKLLDRLWLPNVHYEEDCPDNCQQRTICQRARDVIRILEFILKEISKKYKIYENVKVQMIGSIKEGSRVGTTIDEADTILLPSDEKKEMLLKSLEFNREEQRIKIRKGFYDTGDDNKWIPLELPEELKPFAVKESLSRIENEYYHGIFDESKYFMTFLHEFCQVVHKYPTIPGLPGLQLTLNFEPCDICKDTTNNVTKFVRCRHKSDCKEHMKKKSNPKYEERCNCKVFTSPSLSYTKIGLVLHADFINDQEGDHLNLDIDVSPPQLSFSRRQYKDEYGNIQEDATFDGNPSHKRQYLEKYRPIDWLTEWHKTNANDMTEIGHDQNLLRGGRFRFYNGIEEDIMIEESVLFLRNEDIYGSGGTLSGNKKRVYVTMKIFKKIFEIDGEKKTSFRMKYSVETVLDDRKYETERVGSSLREVVDIEGYKFDKACKPLQDNGVKEVKIDYENERLVFIMEEKLHILEVEEANRINAFNCYGQFSRKNWLIFALCMTVIALIIGVVVVIYLNHTSTEPDPEQILVRTIDPDPELIMFTTTGMAGEYYGHMLGLYREEGEMNGAKYYRQMDRNNIGAYVYRFKPVNFHRFKNNHEVYVWYVGYKKDGTDVDMKNYAASETIPNHGWEIHFNYKWHLDNGTKVELISDKNLSDDNFCRATNIIISEDGDAKKVSYVGGLYYPTLEWSAGRQIFKNDENELYLFMRKGITHWGVRESIDATAGKSYTGAKIVSGSAPGMCPTSPRTAETVLENRTHWAYGSKCNVGGKWKGCWKGSEDISLIEIN